MFSVLSVVNKNSIQLSRHHQHRFLALREDFLQFLLGGHELGVGLFAGIAQGSQLLGDVVSGCVRLSSVSRRSWVALPIAVSVLSPPRLRSLPPPRSNPPNPRMRFANAQLHDLVELGLDDFPLVILGGELFFQAVDIALTHGCRIEISAATTTAAITAIAAICVLALLLPPPLSGGLRLHHCGRDQQAHQHSN